MIEPALTGFVTGFSLILAIGAQNAFVLRQGLIGAHVLPLCLLCALSDAVLISAGVAGFGALALAWPAFPKVMTLAGAAFLTVYGALRLKAAWKGGHQPAEAANAGSLRRTLAIGAAFTWLNPHVYLDTLGLMGAISTNYPNLEAKTAFAVGATTASFCFFFGLGYGARLLAPTMRSPKAWRTLDLIIGLTMLTLATMLLTG
ncbi:LysE/ArgO family amino acid transporter [Roseospirillum parvum]|uniref:L-lysine exporter family protein LysE/ArgO n=1 Tax=Roseospirillum parvum TaxID=83401 RepID=A0A1G8AWA4_9PROT|nr:LysE/ArgO family amino acid transporter [Roseospirillum parvum]SDH25221.1 L-lysine exporter family protein LysE/ArgO [Roseospirillum parvum]